MLAYERLDTCRMAFLTGQLDDPSAAPCGRCDVCAGPWYPTDIDPAASSSATTTLDRVGVPVEPRMTWPSGMDTLGIGLKGRISADETAEEGRVIARLSDLAENAPRLDPSRNSAYRLRDVHDRFSVGPQLMSRLSHLGGAPVLLVDDVISTRWTMTVGARLLRRAGSGPVLPLALALTQ